MTTIDCDSDIPDLVDTSTDDETGFPISDSFGKSLVKCAEEWNSRNLKFIQQQEANIKIFALAPFLFAVEDLLPPPWISSVVKIKSSLQKSRNEDFDCNVIEFVETVIDKVFEFMKSGLCHLDVILDMVQKVNGFAVQNSAINLDLLSETLNNNSTVTSIWKFILTETITLSKQKDAEFLTFYVLRHYYEVVVGVCREGRDVVTEKRKLHESFHQAEEYKEKGNKHFHNGNFSQAIEWYSKSARASPFYHIYYGNRAQAYFKMKNFRKAWEDSKRAVTLKPDWSKGQYRYAKALYKLGEIQKAIQANRKAIEICSNASQDSESLKLLYDQKISFDEEMSEEYLVNGTAINGINQEKEEKTKEMIVRKDDVVSNHIIEEEDILDDVPELISSESDEYEDTDDENEEVKNIFVPEIFELDDVPDLTSSDTGEEIDKQDVQKTRRKKSKKTSKVKVLDNEEILSEDMKSIDDKGKRARNLMTEGSVHYMKGSCKSAVSYYQKALDIISCADLKKYNIEKEDLVVLKFVIGLAAISTKNYKTILDGLEKLRSIFSSHSDVYFPQAFYGIGKSYITLNRFHQAVDPLTEGLRLIINEKRVKEYVFPGMKDEIIQETQRGHVKQLMEENLQLCKFPPAPDAVCKYHTTEELRTVVYFTDPDFKGFVRMTCASTCIIEFHIVCWKNYRETIGNKVRDKDVLNTQCPTPDCHSVIIKIIIHKPDSTVKEFNSEKVLNSRNPSKVAKPVKQPLSSEAKIRRKTELKEMRKQKQRERKKLDEDVDDKIPDDCGHTIASNHPSLDKYEGKDISAAPSSSFTLLRREEDDETDIYKGKQPAKKQKKKKDKTKNVLQLDVNFTDNKEEMLRLVNTFEVDGVELLPEDLVNIPIPPAPKPLPVEDTVVADPCSEALFGFLAGILIENGPLHIDDIILTRELENFPPEAQTAIDKAGSLKAFLKQSLKFAFIDDFVCVLKDAGRAREIAMSHGRALSMAKAVKKNLPIIPPQNRDQSPLNPDAPVFTLLDFNSSTKGAGKRTMDTLDDFNSEKTIDSLDDFTSDPVSMTKTSANIDEVSADDSPTEVGSFQTVSKKKKKKHRAKLAENGQHVDLSALMKPILSKKTQHKTGIKQESHMLNQTKFDDISDEELPYKMSFRDQQDFVETSSSTSDISDSFHHKAYASDNSNIYSPLTVNRNKSTPDPLEGSFDLIDKMNKVDTDLVSELTTSIVEEMCSQSDVTFEERQRLMENVSRDIWSDFEKGKHAYYSPTNCKQNEEITKSYIKEYYSRPDHIQFESHNRASSTTNYFDPVGVSCIPWSTQDDDLPQPKTYSLFDIPQPANISSCLNNLSSNIAPNISNTLISNSLYSTTSASSVQNLLPILSTKSDVHVQASPVRKDASSNTSVEYVSGMEYKDLKSDNQMLMEKIQRIIAERDRLQQSLENEKQIYEKKVAEMNHDRKLQEVKYKQQVKELESRILKIQEECLQLKQNMDESASREKTVIAILGEIDEKNILMEANHKKELIKFSEEKDSLSQKTEEMRTRLENETSDLKKERERSVNAEKLVLNLRKAADSNIFEQRIKEASLEVDEFMKVIASGGSDLKIPLSKAKDCCEFWKNVLLKCEESKKNVETKYTEAIHGIEKGKLLSELSLDGLLLPPPPPDFMKCQSLKEKRSAEKLPSMVNTPGTDDILKSSISNVLPQRIHSSSPIPTMPGNMPENLMTSMTNTVMTNPINPQLSQAPHLSQPRPLLPFGLQSVGGSNISESLLQPPSKPLNTQAARGSNIFPEPLSQPPSKPLNIQTAGGSNILPENLSRPPSKLLNVSVPHLSSSGGGGQSAAVGAPRMQMSALSRFAAPGKTSFGRIIEIVQERFPNTPRSDITQLLALVRKKNDGSFAGMSVNEIINQVSIQISNNNSVGDKQSSASSFITPQANLTKPPPGLDGSWAFRGKKKNEDGEDVSQGKDGDLCVICHETMDGTLTLTLKCTHVFHENCIKQWFQEQSTCPNCRTHCLLQEEFPFLK